MAVSSLDPCALNAGAYVQPQEYQRLARGRLRRERIVLPRMVDAAILPVSGRDSSASVRAAI